MVGERPACEAPGMRAVRMTSVHLDRRARAPIEREAVTRRLRETGGAIFGWESEGVIVVACASGPGSHAKHRLRGFEPAPGTTKAAMLAVASASKGRYAYLGSWHTHPRTPPVPSSIDVGTAEAMAEQSDLRLPAPLLLIISTTGTSLHVEPRNLCAWRWDPVAERLRRARVEDCDLAERHCPPAALLFAA